MSSASIKTRPKTNDSNPPYQPSWLNQLVQWIETRSGPAWPYYVGWSLILGVSLHIIFWMVEYLPMGAISIRQYLYSVYPIYFVGLMHYLDHHAREALAAFRPALTVSDAEFARIEYKLTVVPKVAGWISLIPAAFLGLASAFAGENIASLSTKGFIGVLVIAIYTGFAIACFFILAYHTIRQLRLVDEIHTSATTINLFHSGPAFAFSKLTSRTGIGLVFFAYFSFLQDPPDPSDTVEIFLLVAVIVMAVTAFVLPLLGMQRRLAAEKARLVSEVSSDLDEAYKDLRGRVRSRKYSDTNGLNQTLTSLLSVRSFVNSLPTWPWQMETLRGFLTAVFLPILIWAITRAIERFIPF